MAMLSDDSFSPRARRLWTVFLLLAPLAYIGGILLVSYAARDANALMIDRDQAIRIAREFADSKGFRTEGWYSYCALDAFSDREAYYQNWPEAEIDRARRLAPPALVGVIFVSPDNKENIRIQLTHDGKPYGFTATRPADREVADTGEPAARAIADSAFRARPESADTARFGAPVLKEERTFGVVTRRYSWPYKFDSLPELDLQFVVSVQGKTILADTLEAKIDPAFRTRTAGNRFVIQTAIALSYGLLVVAVLFFGIYRFIQRARQKEISYVRTLLLSGFVSAVFFMILFRTDAAAYASIVQGSSLSRSMLVFVNSITYIFIGSFLGLAYGSGEGDIREAFPGKLTSLDALILGKFFSRNVARAIVVGCAFGGWTLLVTNLHVLVSQHSQQLSEMRAGAGPFLMGRSPWLMPFLSAPLSTLVVIVVGLLLPISFLHRMVRSRRAALLLTILFTWLAQLGQTSIVESWSIGILVATAATAGLLLPFFQFDVLTAMVSLGSSAFAGSTTYLALQPVASIRNGGFLAAAIAIAAVGIQIVLSYRGRLYLEDQVRPLYARHLAERLKLQAEISAAREAQTRLLPVQLPSMSRLSLAAAFRPAHEVGGDFYDLIPLGPDKLGIFFAEGGGRGLGAALSIAFAKGFLMPKLSANMAPAAIVRKLQDRLSLMLNSEEEVGLALAVIDASTNTLQYARTGTYPKIVIGHSPPEEQEVGAEQNPSAIPVFEATCALKPGDKVLLFTDGIGETITPQEFWEDLSDRKAHTSSEQLYEALNKAVDSAARRAKDLGVSDDLAAIAVCLAHPALRAAGGAQ